MMAPKQTSVLLAAALALPAAIPAQTARQFPPAVARYVSVNAPLIALTHVRVIDGTGRVARDDQTIVLRGNRIEAVGSSAEVRIPAYAQVIDLPVTPFSRAW